MGERGQWYTNKELFEQLNQVQVDFNELRLEMRETRKMINKYNGLREKLGFVEEKINKIEAKREGKQLLGQTIREWGGWLFALITLIILIYRG
ncbi:hypothetical protein [Amphibacillus cookii]|uniref:hypothetical protein n=1 Tax=Amphibacillus cookii TaxID=767787 RepID=UPI001956F8E8|nr:hypothetical protein [Amphibacillus cookii]MBM7542351.1 hypothetical protein [Amphibacillus cookii]